MLVPSLISKARLWSGLFPCLESYQRLPSSLCIKHAIQGPLRIISCPPTPSPAPLYYLQFLTAFWSPSPTCSLFLKQLLPFYHHLTTTSHPLRLSSVLTSSWSPPPTAVWGAYPGRIPSTFLVQTHVSVYKDLCLDMLQVSPNEYVPNGLVTFSLKLVPHFLSSQVLWGVWFYKTKSLQSSFAPLNPHPITKFC